MHSALPTGKLQLNTVTRLLGCVRFEEFLRATGGRRSIKRREEPCTKTSEHGCTKHRRFDIDGTIDRNSGEVRLNSHQ
jgi:hypothetical protein